MTRCPKCESDDVLNYYTKPDGEHVIEYFRCNVCKECFEFIYLMGELNNER